MSNKKSGILVALLVVVFFSIYQIIILRPRVTFIYHKVNNGNPKYEYLPNIATVTVSHQSPQATANTPSPPPQPPIPTPIPAGIEPSEPRTSTKEVQENFDPAQKNSTTIVSLRTATTRSSPIKQPQIIEGTCYDVAASDRSGAVINNMLEAHYFSFKRNLTFGGACPPDEYAKDFNGNPGGALRNFNKRLPVHESLLNVLGLKDELPFACPPNEKNQSVIQLGRYDFRKPIVDPQWLKHIRARTNVQKIEARRTFHVAVHVRRGDVIPW